MLHIGPYAFTHQALLAPMAGISDLPTRRIAREFGAALTPSEMLTSQTQLWTSAKSSYRLKTDSNEKVISMQIAGSEAKQMAEAAKACEQLGANIVDINMGCPAKKVCKKAAGSALLRDEKLVNDILEAVVNSVDIPVTLKTRTGWDENSKNALTIARIAEAQGIAALTLHGRTRACRFKEAAEYDTIASVVAAVSIPVIANGDICSAKQAKAVLHQTNASAVMIGRAALGNPWLFSQINHLLTQGEELPEPSASEILRIATKHCQYLYDFYGQDKGLQIARKHMAWYFSRLPESRETIKEFNQLTTSQSQQKAIQQYRDRLMTNEEKAA